MSRLLRAVPLVVTATIFAMTQSADTHAQTQPPAGAPPAAAQPALKPPTSPTFSGSRVFEMRTYYAHPGKIEDLHKRFRDHTTALFKKHGMENVGYWVAWDKPEVLVYILAHKSKEAADASWKAFREDPVWLAARKASEAAGPIVQKVEVAWLSATDYSAIR
jgi:NIPSNAP